VARLLAGVACLKGRLAARAAPYPGDIPRWDIRSVVGECPLIALSMG
jgi:hypothetical protein